MYIMKNAWTSIWRNKGRNILVGIIVMVIAISCTITLSIYNSANNLIKSYENSYEVTATIEVNRQNFMGNMKPNEEGGIDDLKDAFSNLKSLTQEDILKYGNSEYVKKYTYTMSVGVNAKDLEKATSEIMIAEIGGNKEHKPNAVVSNFTLVGYNSVEAMNEFLSGTYKIKDGSISSDFTDNSCIINQELATINNLSVGDTITIVSPNDSTKTLKLTITGIYTDASENDDKMSLFSTSANSILTNTSMVEKMMIADSTLEATVNPTFYLTSKDDIDKFSEELKSKGLSEYYQVGTNLSDAENALSSISNLKTFSVTFLIITFIIGAVVLFILNMINVRERKYEIGVLRTIGMKKTLVAMQFICELLIVSLASLVIGLGIGAILSVPTANALLQSEIEKSENKRNEISGNFGGMEIMTEEKGNNKGIRNFDSIQIGGVANVEKVTSINVVVDFIVVLELLGVGIILTIISSFASIVSIMRFSPLSILKERS